MAVQMNAIVPQAAATFIVSFMEALEVKRTIRRTRPRVDARLAPR